MNLSLFARTAAPSEGAPATARAMVTGFRRLSCRGTGRLLLGGELTYVMGAKQGSVRVSMTWAAYSRLLDVMRLEDVQLPEEVVIAAVLQRWGRHQVECSMAAGDRTPPQGYILDFEGGPFSSRPRQVLEECLLVGRSPGSASPVTYPRGGASRAEGGPRRGLLPRKLQSVQL